MPPQEPSRLTIPYRTLALAGVLMTLATTTALVLISAVKGVDALTTVALALAILAFVVQILFYVAQTAASSQQGQQMMMLNSATQSLLENVKTNVSGMEELLKSHFEYVLKKAFEVRSPVEEADASGEDPEPSVPSEPEPIYVTPALAASRGLRPVVPPGNAEDASLLQPRLLYSPLVGPFTPGPEDLEVLRALQNFPEEQEGRQLFETLRQLTPLRIAVFSNYARNEREARKRGVRGYFASGGNGYRSQQLEELGLLEHVPEHPSVVRPSSLENRVGLSEKGLQTARLLTGRGPVPPWLIELESSEGSGPSPVS